MQFNTKHFFRLTQTRLHNDFQFSAIFRKVIKFCKNPQYRKNHASFRELTFLILSVFCDFCNFFANFAIFAIACRQTLTCSSLLPFKQACCEKYFSAYFKVTSLFSLSFCFIFVLVLCLQICKFNNETQNLCTLSTGVTICYLTYFFHQISSHITEYGPEIIILK